MKFLWLICALFISANTLAGSIDESWYVGGGPSAMRINGLCTGAPANLCDDSSLGLSVRGGWYLNRYLTIEGSVDTASSFTSPAARSANLNGKTTVSLAGIGLVGFLPVGEKVSLIGGASVVYGEASTKIYADGFRSRDCNNHYSGWSDDWQSYCRNHNDDEYHSDGSASFGAQVGIEIEAVRHVHVRIHAQRYFSVDGGLAFGQHRDLDTTGIAVLLAF